MMNHKGTVTLETERLILRRFNVDDAGAMFKNWASEVMAVYNILRLRNANKNLANIAYDVESRNGTIALGFFGTDPTHFGEYFRGQGISATAYTNLTTLENAAKEMSSSQQIIFTAWNDTSIFKGAHVVCVEKKANSINYSVYNATGYGYGASTYSSLASYIGNGSLMIGYIVG